MSTPFTEQIVEYCRAVSRNELTDHQREQLSYLLEAMTNLDCEAKVKVFEDLIKCYPKLNYNEAAKYI